MYWLCGAFISREF